MKKSFDVIYLGGPTVILEFGGLRIMTDPTLDPLGSLFSPNPVTTIEKLASPALEHIGKIDVVLLSHDQHADNLDQAGRELLKTVPQVFSTKAAEGRLQGSVKGMAPWESVSVKTPDGDEIIITATPARHGPAHVEPLAGDVIGFVLTIKGEESYEIYLTGDTVFYNGVAEVAEKFHPQYVFIFAGASKIGLPFNLTMGSNDAIDTAFTFPQSIIIPVHFEGWSHYTESGEVLTQAFQAMGIGGRLKILPAGEKVTLS